REEQVMTRDRESGPDEQEYRRPDRRAEPDHRDFQEPEVPSKLDLNLAALCHRVAAEWESLISPWWARRRPSNTPLVTLMYRGRARRLMTDRVGSQLSAEVVSMPEDNRPKLLK